MDDQLKKYVQQHRDEFDHLEPDPAIFEQIKKQVRPQPVQKTTVLSLFITHKWMAAASIVLVLSLGYFLTMNNKKTGPMVGGEVAKQADTSLVKDLPFVAKQNENPQIAALPSTGKTKSARLKKAPSHVMSAIYKDLTDSTSASTRLSAVLKIQQSDVMTNDIINRLAKTLNHDPNSNVRMAVLDVASKYAQDQYVSNVFLQSLTTQKDPMVQLELMNLLSRTNDSKLDEKLYALINNPETANPVRDQAYQILLDQNKL